MIKYLHRLKGKKGFTLVELVVVVGIIAILTTILLVNLLSGNTEQILAANSNAEAFFPACQLAFTRAQLTERSLVTYADTETKFIEYKDGKNKIPDGKYLFVEAKFQQSGMVWLHINFTLNELTQRPDDGGADMQALEKYFMTNIDEYLTESYDGYFYALIDNNFKVQFTHYCDYRFPSYTDKVSFINNMMISNGKVVGNSAILGSCSDVYTIPTTGDYVFGMPSSGEDKDDDPDNEIDYDKFFD